MRNNPRFVTTITQEQENRLRQEAKETDRPMARIVQRALRLYFESVDSGAIER